MGLAISRKLTKADNYSLTYYAPQPRATLRIVNPDKPEELMPYDQYGRVELTTMTKEFSSLASSSATKPSAASPATNSRGDGVGDVRPFQSLTKTIIEACIDPRPRRFPKHFCHRGHRARTQRTRRKKYSFFLCELCVRALCSLWLTPNSLLSLRP